jgi:hypothetical protein
VHARAGAACGSSFETLALPPISKEKTGFGRCHHGFVIRASSAAAAELLIKVEPRFSRMGAKGRVIQGAEDNWDFSGAGSGG